MAGTIPSTNRSRVPPWDRCRLGCNRNGRPLPACWHASAVITFGHMYEVTSGDGREVSYLPQRGDFQTCLPKIFFAFTASARSPAEFTDNYREACLTFSDSPKASAALSRRCLQYLLR